MKKITKKFIHKFFIDERGAVSIYLIVIALFLFLFNAVLIDYARIIIAERQTETAARTALRSTMASYNTKLQDKGLFAFDGDSGEANSVFKEVFAKNLESGDGDGFDLLGLNPVDAETNLNLNLERSLANKDILRYQILEEMKYKAPVIVGEKIITQFLSVSELVEETSDYVKISKSLNELSKEREELLDEVEELLKEAKEILKKKQNQIMNGSNENHSEYPEVNRLYDIFYWHSRYREDMEAIAQDEDGEESEDEDEDSEEGEDEGESIQDKKDHTSDFITNARTLVDGIISTSNSAADKLEQALEKVSEADDLNEEIKEKIEEHKSSGGTNDYDDAKEIADELEPGTGMDEGALDDYVIKGEFFTELHDAIEEALKQLKNGQGSEQTNSLIKKMESGFLKAIDAKFEGNGNNKNSILNHVENSRKYYEQTLEEIDKALDLLQNNEDRKKYEDNEEKMEEEEEKGDEERDKNKDLLEEIEEGINEGKGIAEDQENYNQLREKAERYGNAIENNNEEFEMDDKDAAADQALGFLDNLFKAIGDMLLNARDEVYINEYILLRYNSHDFEKSGSDANKFDNNQVEYVIYGLNGHGLNYFAAIGEITMVRFGLNLAAGFMQKEAKVFGPYMWVYALAYAFMMTYEDMVNITDGKPVNLFHVKLTKKNIMPKMDYKDHLRLFLLLHFEGGKFERLMAVTDLETSSDLEQAPTYVSADATATVKLWFLPQIIEMLENTDAINGRVEGNEFYIEKKVNFSY